MSDAVVVGAGVGGLSAAISLAAAGRRVTMLEAMARPGGKLGIGTSEGVEFDTGPSVLTLPGTVDEVLRLAGTSLAVELKLRAPDPGFRYLYPDGVELDVFLEPERTLASVEAVLGAAAAGELEGFLSYSRRIWEAAAPAFVFGEAPSLAGLARRGPSLLLLLPRIDPLRRMWSEIRRRVRSPHLRMLLARYATYNGSDVRRAPATLNCIAHVELSLGGYGVEGGMYEIVRALVRAAERVGVEIRCGDPAAEVALRDGAVAGVRTQGGEMLSAPVVVANTDVRHLYDDLLPTRRGSRAGAASMSGWVGVMRARRRTGEERRIAHTVLFPERYMEEFEDIFERGRPPREPTVYLCAQEAAHGRRGWAEEEPLFVMANAPPVGGGAGEGAERLRAAVMERIHSARLVEGSDRFVYERTPTDLAEQFPGSRGSIYGAASNSLLAAFRRPANRVSGVRGLYLASGGAHPGGGVPLCLLSGRAAAWAVAEDGGTG